MKRLSVLFVILALFLPFVTVQAETNKDGYSIVIDDGADLLTENEEKLLKVEMVPITEYGNCVFVSAYASEDTPLYARHRYEELFGDESGTLFVIDMNHRNIWIFSKGSVYSVITKAYANTITDNVYRYASKGDYYNCAANVYRQEYTLLRGGKIATPMKHITNILISVIAALLINFLILLISRRKAKPSEAEIVKAVAASSLIASAAGSKVLKTKKIHRPEPRTFSDSGSSGSSWSGGSGGGGGFSGGGSFGGGGSSGGGGGHSF
ncbi:MAG: TPM domain-containing protein [Solobacterium sp.]|nr:TPM domain-containing protein [Solobacterium sp.]